MQRILIADDSAVIRVVLRRMVTRLGLNCEILEATDGENVMDTYFECEPSVILLDVEMPQVNGWEILRCIRDIDEETRVIMVTASKTPDDVLKAIALGADGFVGKPFDHDELLDALGFTTEFAMSA